VLHYRRYMCIIFYTAFVWWLGMALFSFGRLCYTLYLFHISSNADNISTPNRLSDIVISLNSTCYNVFTICLRLCGLQHSARLHYARHYSRVTLRLCSVIYFVKLFFNFIVVNFKFTR
jgi:hypothetical protein